MTWPKVTVAVISVLILVTLTLEFDIGYIDIGHILCQTGRAIMVIVMRIPPQNIYLSYTTTVVDEISYYPLNQCTGRMLSAQSIDEK